MDNERESTESLLITKDEECSKLKVELSQAQSRSTDKEEQILKLQNKVENLIQQNLGKDEAIQDFVERLAEMQGSNQELVGFKIKYLKSQEEMSVLKENYENQISELSQKLIEMMTRKANEY